MCFVSGVNDVCCFVWDGMIHDTFSIYLPVIMQYLYWAMHKQSTANIDMFVS